MTHYKQEKTYAEWERELNKGRKISKAEFKARRTLKAIGKGIKEGYVEAEPIINVVKKLVKNAGENAQRVRAFEKRGW